MPESNFNFKINVPNRNPHSFRTILTLSEAIDLIKNKNYPEDMEKKLIIKLKSLPSGTYENFFKNIYKHIARLSNKDKGNKENDKSSS